MLKDNLISLRKIHNLSQEEVAERIGVSRQTLSITLWRFTIMKCLSTCIR